MWGRGKPMAVSQGGVTSGQTSGQGTEEMDHFEQSAAFRGTRVQPFVACAPLTRSLNISRRAAPTPIRASLLAPAAPITVRGWDGSESGTQNLSLIVADPETSKGLVHRYLITVRQNMRAGTASTLTRGEVRGGGRKPYKQKGTGNARRGSTRSPLIVGGGVAFGPKPRDWTIGMNKKERRLALATALQSAAPDMVVVGSVAEAVPEVKTKNLVAKLESIGVFPMEEKVLLIVAEPTEAVALSARNVENLSVNRAEAVRIYDLLNADRIVVESRALDFLNAQFGLDLGEEEPEVEGELSHTAA
ncbi:hypothetical protein APUTEX25_002253 [Auxenochlorella protothecoides]|uniref:Large ribosomal subunit protein uL4c n=1 Tax=Auxenochlorella protothecoides TaxID=3075 RepID=A0A3M7L2N9_AUXPR|nr:hypothetical protein APUTEX25_002253 [Auxenochlorella protothecoides]|eukprot:RMZ57021.1 hypothetical protein APUTEX25_002253 [Auxenochlorella protothecoides]